MSSSNCPSGMTQREPPEQSCIKRYARCRRRTPDPSATGIDNGSLYFRLGWPLDETVNSFPQASGPCPSFML